MELALRAFDAEENDKARRTLDTLLAQQPHHEQALLLSGRLYERKLLYGLAMAEFQRGKGEEAQASARRLARENLIQEAQHQLEDGQPLKARQTAEQCLSILPDLAQAKLLLIESLIVTGQDLDALDQVEALRDCGHPSAEIDPLLSRLAERNPQIALQLAQERLGDTLEEIKRLVKGSPEKALAPLANVLEQFPEDITANRLHGEALEKLGRDREAAGAFARVLEFSGRDDPELLHHCYELLADNSSPEELLPWLDQLIDRGGPEVARLRRHRASLYRELGQPEAALADLQTVLNNEDNDPTLLEQVVSLKKELGDLEGALASLGDLLSCTDQDVDRREVLEHIANLKTELGDVGGALSVLVELVELLGDGVDSELLERVVDLETETGDIQGALTHLAQLIDQTPAGESCRFELLDRAAALKMEIGDVDGALEDMSRLLAILPENGDEAAQLLERTATIRVERGDIDGALTDLADLLQRTPQEAPNHLKLLDRTINLRLKQGDFQGTLDSLTQLLEETPISDRNPLLDRTAAVRLQMGDKTGALADLESRLASTPENTEDQIELLRQTANLQLELGDLPKALSSYNRLLAQDPSDLEVRLRAASMKVEHGDVDGALADYNIALEHSPDDLNLLFNLGNCQMLQLHLEEAIKTYTHMLKIAPDDRQALLNRAACFRQVMPRQHARARDDLERALSLS